jgi:hypothetical protein
MKRAQEAHPNFDMLTFESMDEDVCPADCVTEVVTPKEFKAKCQVRALSFLPLSLNIKVQVCAV